MKTFRAVLSAIAMATMLAGCSSGVVAAGPNTYMVSSSGAGFGTGGVRSSVYRQANEFCAKRGLVMVPVSFDAQGGELGRRPPSADLTFRALPPGDPEIKWPNLEQPNYIQRVQVR